MLSNLFIFIALVLIAQVFDTKIIVGVGVMLFILINYDNIGKIGNTSETTKVEIKKGNFTNDMYYNNKIHGILVQLKKFKKYNKVSFKSGVTYMRKFFKTIHILEKDEITNYNQYFDNAFLYLKTGINHFQSITVSLPERDYVDGIKYGDYESTKKGNELGTLCKELYRECYYVLLNLSLKLNQKWVNNPMVINKEITMNTDHVIEHNEKDEVNWSLY